MWLAPNSKQTPTVWRTRETLYLPPPPSHPHCPHLHRCLCPPPLSLDVSLPSCGHLETPCVRIKDVKAHISWCHTQDMQNLQDFFSCWLLQSYPWRWWTAGSQSPKLWGGKSSSIRLLCYKARPLFLKQIQNLLTHNPYEEKNAVSWNGEGKIKATQSQESQKAEVTVHACT